MRIGMERKSGKKTQMVTSEEKKLQDEEKKEDAKRSIRKEME